jgi:predicted membrane-bound spermidine synthase
MDKQNDGVVEMKKSTAGWKLLAAAFLSGFAVMGLELLESRLMAPYFGTSILVWTNIIGVILAAMALGAWVGGRLADRYPTYSTLALFFILSGAWAVFLWQCPRLGWCR